MCETSLICPIELPRDYTVVPANNLTNTRHSGVGLFFKNSLPLRSEMICLLMNR